MPSAADLQPGDVLLAVGHFDTASHKFINGGQTVTLAIRNAASIVGAFMSGNLATASLVTRDTSLCHAMIYVGNFQVAEAVGRGITMNDIEFPHEYKVWRYKQSGVATDVMNTAINWARPEAGKYRHIGCATSPLSIAGLGPMGKRQVDTMSRRIDQPLTAADGMICTEFVILCWNATCKANGLGTAIDVDARSCSPMELGYRLSRSKKWTTLGSFNINEYGGSGRARRGAVSFGGAG
jgi:hypothetical protein